MLCLSFVQVDCETWREAIVQPIVFFYDYFAYQNAKEIEFEGKHYGKEKLPHGRSKTACEEVNVH